MKRKMLFFASILLYYTVIFKKYQYFKAEYFKKVFKSRKLKLDRLYSLA